MLISPISSKAAAPWAVASVAAVLLTATVFLLDTFSPLEFSVAVLYVVVVVIVDTSSQRRVVLQTALICSALTLGSYFLVHGAKFAGTPPIRAGIGLTAIGITTFLLLRNRAVQGQLKQTERQRTNLARFFPPHLVDRLMDSDEALSITQKQPSAVMFVDMIGFSAHCARLPPEAVIAMLRDLQARLSSAVFGNNGTIDKFMGDGLLAVFGAPMPSPVDVTNAVRAAIDIQATIALWNAERDARGEAAIRVAVGIHYGEVVFGDVGGDRQLELTVVGDTVNVASLVEAHCRLLQVPILVTGSAIDALYDEGSDGLAAQFVYAGYHILRGHTDPIRLFSWSALPAS
jgi:class 3 adenylate cyclase